MIDVFELAIFLTNNEDDWEAAIEEMYDMPYDAFEALVNDLLPLVTVAESPLTKTVYKGFADVSHCTWLVKTEADYND